ncbi:MAG: sensor histidine kinase [Terriglobia bacterium]
MPFTADSKPDGEFHGFLLEQATWALRFTGTLAIAAAITFVCFRAIPMGAAAAGFFFLVAIVAISAGWGLPEALVASAAAMFCFDYFFLPPIKTLGIRSSSHREAFVAFAAAAVAASLLAARGARHRGEHAGPQHEMERLYALSRAILLMDAAHPVAKQIAFKIAQIFELPALALYDRESGEILRAGPEDMPGIEDRLREVAVRGTLFEDARARITVTAIRLGGGPIGSIAWRGPEFSDGALHALSNLVAIGLERVRGQEAANEAEAARQSQELKSTLLDAIAHEFKTPLTSIKAATSALLATPMPPSLERQELVTIIDEEADRLARLVTGAIQMARVEGGKMQLTHGSYPVDALIRAALEAMQPRLEGRTVQVNIAAGLPAVMADGDLIVLALRQLVDNAVKYSPARSPLALHAKATERRVIISVADQGQGIAEAQQQRIFDKFYRVPVADGTGGGTGIGLAIAREILSAHAGDVWVESKLGEGSEFFISIPVSSQEKPA